ncbi:ABC transporter permease [Chryseobacterium sp. HSC-36S06]|uniref:MlaE family ABC transporter permease n=1 Tax=Chryseobacterium sp. HSC-36S06 TaxID=2910970 RepID=UPI0020A0C034|nr:ABC transporter permease [Chryseobacterium sp. HSC-36S06]
MLLFNHILKPLKLFLVEIGELSYFTGRFFREVLKKPYEFPEFLKQCFYIGNRSLFLVTVTGLIIGLVFTLQTRPTLAEFGAVSMIPAMVSISIIREIGPIITGLMCAGKIGSGIGAEIGSMRVTEQIDAMEVSGTNPFKYLVVTRILATTVMLPVLVIYSDFIAIVGSYLVENTKGQVSFTLYFNQVFKHLEFSDVIPATLKSFFFGFAIGLVGCFKGYFCQKGTEGVGIAANSAVVYSSMFLFLIDFIAVLITNIFVT